MLSAGLTLLTALTLSAGCAGRATPEVARSVAADPTAGTPSRVPSAGPPTRGLPSPAVPTPGSSTDPDNPQDQLGAPIVVSGTVDTTGNCTVLDTGTVRWLLTGQLVTQLRDGATATVRGRPATLPAGCRADRALEVRKIG